MAQVEIRGTYGLEQGGTSAVLLVGRPDTVGADGELASDDGEAPLDSLAAGQVAYGGTVAPANSTSCRVVSVSNSS